MRSHTLQQIEQVLMMLEQNLPDNRTDQRSDSRKFVNYSESHQLASLNQLWVDYLKGVRHLKSPMTEQTELGALSKHFDAWFKQYFPTVWQAFQVQRILQYHENFAQLFSLQC